MNISLNISEVDVIKMSGGGKFIDEFIPRLESIDAYYEIVYNRTNEGSINMVFNNIPDDAKKFVDILDEIKEYFSNDILDNCEIESLNKR